MSLKWKIIHAGYALGSIVAIVVLVILFPQVPWAMIAAAPLLLSVGSLVGGIMVEIDPGGRGPR